MAVNEWVYMLLDGCCEWVNRFFLCCMLFFVILKVKVYRYSHIWHSLYFVEQYRKIIHAFFHCLWNKLFFTISCLLLYFFYWNKKRECSALLYVILSDFQTPTCFLTLSSSNSWNVVNLHKFMGRRSEKFVFFLWCLCAPTTCCMNFWKLIKPLLMLSLEFWCKYAFGDDEF